MLDRDEALLKMLIRDGKTAPPLYRAGPYWEDKRRNATREFRRKGLEDFRGGENGGGISFADNLYVDTRLASNFGPHWIVSWILRNIYPFRRLFDSQVILTREYARRTISLLNQKLSSDPRVANLLRKYEINFETTRGGCESFLELNGQQLSHHYLELLWTLDQIATAIPITRDTKFMEIGGGFGANVHLLIEHFGVKKFLYIDIAPNLYVGAQYLRSFYGDCVIDYRMAKDKPVRFGNSSDLEIFCLLPHQIENVDEVIDVFHNANSFVEMPLPVVQNYANLIQSKMTPGQGFVSLVSYGGYDLDTTLDPHLLPSFFGQSESPQLIESLLNGRENFYYMLNV